MKKFLILTLLVIFILGCGSYYLVFVASENERWERNEPKNRVLLNLDIIKEALVYFHKLEGVFPSQDKGLSELVTKDVIKKLPLDPWGNEFVYIFNEKSNTFKVCSYGKNMEANSLKYCVSGESGI